MADSLKDVTSDGGLASARTRLSENVLKQAFNLSGPLLNQAHQSSEVTPLFAGCQVVLTDGSTLTARSHGDIPTHFPRAENHHGETYWSKVRVTVLVDLHSGILLAMGAESTAKSEQVMLAELLLQGPTEGARGGLTPWLIVGDANFGIWLVAAVARQVGHHVLDRMKMANARHLAKRQNVTFREGMDADVVWSPTRDNIGQELISAEHRNVRGRLIYQKMRRKGFRTVDLCLFTTQSREEASVEELLECYSSRWKVELRLRDFKSTLDMESLHVRSAAMVRKEIWTGGIAYNLVRATMAASAATSTDEKASAEKLSFARAMEALFWYLLGARPKPPPLRENGEVEPSPGETWFEVLRELLRKKLPNRKRQRPSEPRLKRHRREKFGPLRGDRQTARAMWAAMLANSEKPKSA